MTSEQASRGIVLDAAARFGRREQREAAPAASRNAHVLPPLGVTPSEWTAIRLRAGLYYNGNVEAYMRGALTGQTRTIKPRTCPECADTMVPEQVTSTLYTGVQVTGLPGHRCSTCGGTQGPSAYFMAELEEVVGGCQTGTVLSLDQLLAIPMVS